MSTIPTTSIKLTFLGTGTSQGVPMIGCSCPICASSALRDRRYRTSALLTLNDTTNILIDASPEFRLQSLENNITHIDAVLITHPHADHIFGLDDIRRYCQIQQSPIPLYAHPSHHDILDRCFSYARVENAANNPNRPQLKFLPLTAPLTIAGHTITPIPQQHGDILSLGFRVGPLAYCTDFNHMPPESLAQLHNLDTLVLGALRPKPHPTHIHFDRAFELVNLLTPRQTYFTHLTHNVSHTYPLPPRIQLAYDRLQITFLT